ncbi:MAG TPA: isochorismatase family protein [Pyrinomonadaceae bacterium]|nr:isochorismatase family protein [Pyrinomonadaceae bacterium]
MLVIIDCQKQFPAVERVIAPVSREIGRAKKRSEWIMVVTYGGRTVTRIASQLRGYQKVVKVNKDYDDGSAVIFERLFAYHWRKKSALGVKHVGRVRHLRVAGVNTSACVMKTVDGLRRFVRVTVISDACANSANMKSPLSPEIHHKGALRRMAKWNNVTIG